MRLNVRKVEVLKDGMLEIAFVRKWKIIYWSLKEAVVESCLPLTELYLKYEYAMTIEEID